MLLECGSLWTTPQLRSTVPIRPLLGVGSADCGPTASVRRSSPRKVHRTGQHLDSRIRGRARSARLPVCLPYPGWVLGLERIASQVVERDALPFRKSLPAFQPARRRADAAMALGSSDQAISGIALDCGLEKVSHLCKRHFHCGVTPRACSTVHARIPVQAATDSNSLARLPQQS